MSVSKLTPSLSVTELQINVSNLDYIELGEKLQPTKNDIAINSNFIHRAFTGYEQFLAKPKVKKPSRRKNTPDIPISGCCRKCTGDGSVFNTCIEFTIIIDNDENTKVVQYFPRSERLQIFSSIIPVAILLHYLYETELPEFSSVNLVGEKKPLLLNYKFVINIGDNKIINLACLARDLDTNDSIRNRAAFPIHYVKYDVGDIHSKIAIVFTSKIRVHKAELTAALIYEFFRNIFIAKWDDFVNDMPTPSQKNKDMQSN